MKLLPDFSTRVILITLLIISAIRPQCIHLKLPTTSDKCKGLSLNCYNTEINDELMIETGTLLNTQKKVLASLSIKITKTNPIQCFKLVYNFTNHAYRFLKCIEGEDGEKVSDSLNVIISQEIENFCTYVHTRIITEVNEGSSMVITPHVIKSLLSKLCIDNTQLKKAVWSENMFTIKFYDDSTTEEVIPLILPESTPEGVSIDFYFTQTPNLKELDPHKFYPIHVDMFPASDDHIKLIITSANHEYELFISRYVIEGNGTILPDDFILDEYGPELADIFQEILGLNSAINDQVKTFRKEGDSALINVKAHIESFSLPLVVSTIVDFLIAYSGTEKNSSPVKKVVQKICNIANIKNKDMCNSKAGSFNSNFDQITDPNDFLFEDDDEQLSPEPGIESMSIENLQEINNLKTNHVKMAYAITHSDAQKDKNEMVYVDIYSFDTDFYKSVDVKFHTVNFSSEYLLPWDNEVNFRSSLGHIYEKFIDHVYACRMTDLTLGSATVKVKVENVLKMLYENVPENFCYRSIIIDNSGVEIYVSINKNKDCNNTKEIDDIFTTYFGKENCPRDNSETIVEGHNHIHTINVIKSNLSCITKLYHSIGYKRIVNLTQKQINKGMMYSLNFTNLDILLLPNDERNKSGFRKIFSTSYDFFVESKKDQTSSIENFIKKHLSVPKVEVDLGDRKLKSSRGRHRGLGVILSRTVDKTYDDKNLASVGIEGFIDPKALILNDINRYGDNVIPL